MSQYIQVAVQDANIYFDKLYTYAVPAHLEGHIFVGSMVLCPFGNGKNTRPRVGVVAGFGQKPDKPGIRIKEVIDAAGEEDALSEEMLAVVQYLKKTTFCTWFEAVRAVVPYGAQYAAVYIDGEWRLQSRLRRTTQKVYRLVSPPPEGAKKPSEKQKLVLDYLREAGPHSKADIMELCGVGPGVADTLVKNGWLLCGDEDKAVELEEVSLCAGVPAANYVLNAEQQAVFEALRTQMEQGAQKPALLHGITGSGKTALFLELARHALSMGKTALILVPEIGLTPQMIERLRACFGALVAVQHSGLSRTERLLQWRAIRRGEARVVVGTRSAVFAPMENIGLIVIDEEQERSYQSESAPRYDAADIARRRAGRHGALLLLASATPSVASYYHAMQGRYSLFKLTKRYNDLPLPQVDMVDMHDEMLDGNIGALSDRLAMEIDNTLDEDGQVILLLNRRGYHRVARCKSCGEIIKCDDCSVPMIYHAQPGEAFTISQPGVRPQWRGEGGMLQLEGQPSAAEPAPATPEAADALAIWQRIAPKPGRRAGKAPVQPEPDTPPVLEAEATMGGKLMCHYCGKTREPAPATCPSCGGAMHYYGFGTQRVEEELADRFPTARILRMDTDTTSQKGAHGRLLSAFGRGEYDIMIGTQMVAKGLDFERVGLVGVIGIDSLLFSPGYRAQEHVFSLVTQVVGRAGRAGRPGRAIIQTMDPENPVLALAAKQDYPAFYEQEIAFRQGMLYPPLCGVCLLVFTAGACEADAIAASRAFAAMLTDRARQNPSIPLRVLGPAPMTVAQIKGAWRWRLTLKCRPDDSFRALVQETLEEYHAAKWTGKASVYIDFNADTAQ